MCYVDLHSTPIFHFPFRQDHTEALSYRVCSSRLSVFCASHQSLGERAGGRGRQFSRDALGASPSRAHQAGADPAALRVSYTLAGCH